MPLSVLIIGGSLGGLSAALWLRHHGHHVTILERSSHPLSGKGAGIVLNPATLHYLADHLPHSPFLSHASLPVSTLRYLPHGPVVRAPYRLASYNSLLAAMQAPLDMQHYHLDARVVAIQQRLSTEGGGVHVVTANGTRWDADLLVCADGTESSAREMLLGDAAGAAVYAGYIAWRGVVPEHVLTPAAREMLGTGLTLHAMPDGHMLTYPIPVVVPTGPETKCAMSVCVNWLWYRNTAEGAEGLDAVMTDVQGRRRARSVPMGKVREEVVGQMRGASEGLPPVLQEVIGRTEQPFVQAIYDYETARMVVGRACIMGDAAFSARPHVAVGTAKAAEDARVLAEVLGAGGREGLEERLGEWERRQMEVGRKCVRRGREVGERLQGGRWKVGGGVEFGLYRVGDSEME